jgi:hypothetical protein
MSSRVVWSESAGKSNSSTQGPVYVDDDGDWVRVPINITDLERKAENSQESNEESKPAGIKDKVLRRLSLDKSRRGEIKEVVMSREDYLKYWAQDKTGQFLPTIQEPPNGRKNWLNRQIELNVEWHREEGSLRAPAKGTRGRLVGDIAPGM